MESDFSQAAFYLVAGALGNDVTLLDLNLDSLQGDKATIDFLKQMNCEIVENDEGIKVVSHGLKASVDTYFNVMEVNLIIYNDDVIMMN